MSREAYCEDHKKVKRNFRSSRKMGYDYRWEKFRKAYLERHINICKHCGMFTNRPELDHRIPHNGNPKLFFDESNIDLLCKSCHSKKTRREQQEGKVGGWGNVMKDWGSN